MGRLAIVAVLLFCVILEISMAARPLHKPSVLFQSMPRGSVPPSCASGCRNYGSSKGSTGCSCPAGSINAAGASLPHPKFHGGSSGVEKSISVDQNL
ncbi:hypothetical protein SUGI_0375070 [Cryptomeria japonica]|nr:hypothetical protein SUGI_0375070 [Cryptomeria japonica]